MSSHPSSSSATLPRKTPKSMGSTDSASAHPETHARFELQGGPPYSLDAILHVSRYVWAAQLFVQPDHHVLDFGCGTGFGVALLSPRCGEVVGIDLDPNVIGLEKGFSSPTHNSFAPMHANPISASHSASVAWMSCSPWRRSSTWRTTSPMWRMRCQ